MATTAELDARQEAERLDNAELEKLDLRQLVDETDARWAKYQEAQLDVRIVQRDGGDVAAAQAVQGTLSNSWYRARAVCKRKLEQEIREKLSVEPSRIRSLLS